MRIPRLTILVYLLGTMIGFNCNAASQYTEHTLKLDEGESGPKAAIGQVAWFAGAWHGDAFGGRFDEMWTPPRAGTMMGMYRLFQDGKPAMYEVFLVVEQEGTLVLQLKHFTNTFKGWEHKDEHVSFPLVKIERDAAYFDGLTYRRISDDQLQVFLAMGTKDGVIEQEFLHQRVIDE